MIVISGENVYSAQVEYALAGQPAVPACAVLGVPASEWGERVHAVVVPLSDQKATADHARVHCTILIVGHRAPRTVDFVDALPMSIANKILKRELHKQYWDSFGNQVS